MTTRGNRFVRRFTTGLIAFTAFTGVVLVGPVYAEDGPEAAPVTTATEEVALGSVDAPAPEADVQTGTTVPVEGVPDTAPALTVSRTDVAPFSLVGVTWAYDPAVTDVLVQVRVQVSDGGWGAWTEVGTEDAGADAGHDGGAGERRGGTSPLWTGPSTGVEVELVTRSGAAPVDVQLDLVDPGTSEADGSLTAPAIQDTAHAAAAMPHVYSRAQWGADEGFRTWDPEYAPTIQAATLHHTADTNNYTAEQVPAMMRSIYRYHAVSLGWGDIGYNVIVDKFGRLWEGRAGGLASTVIGAHAGGFNTGTFGVSMLGNYETAPTTRPMVDAVAAIVAWKFSLYGIDPAGTTRLTSRGGGTSKYSAGTAVTLPTLFGHRDVGSTACPGRYGYAELPGIRAQVVDRMPNLADDMAERLAAAGGTASLGSPVGQLQSSGDVSWQVYAKGRIYWSPSTGATVLLNGPLLDKYLAWGGPAAVGAPSSDERSTWRNQGKYVSFSGGGIYWSPATGAHVVKGAIFDTWARNGWETGMLGYPDQRARRQLQPVHRWGDLLVAVHRRALREGRHLRAVGAQRLRERAAWLPDPGRDQHHRRRGRPLHGWGDLLVAVHRCPGGGRSGLRDLPAGGGRARGARLPDGRGDGLLRRQPGRVPAGLHHRRRPRQGHGHHELTPGTGPGRTTTRSGDPWAAPQPAARAHAPPSWCSRVPRCSGSRRSWSSRRRGRRTRRSPSGTRSRCPRRSRSSSPRPSGRRGPVRRSPAT
ncbi:hypothetical protein E9529_09855 [Blastococcus sp. KM273128]|nr:hypothetical protein [Blastococcus sp. KM273128]